MLLLIKTLTGNTILVDVDPYCTIDNVKAKLQEEKGFPMSQQQLIFAGNRLKGNRTLKDYDITAKATVGLMLRLWCKKTVHATFCKDIHWKHHNA